MDSDPGEGTSNGQIKRKHKRKTKNKSNWNDQELIIKEEIKEEPTETDELHEHRRLPSTTETNNSFELENDRESDDQLDCDDDIDWMKKEIKNECKEEEKAMKESDPEQNEQSNEIDVGDQEEVIPTTSPNSNGKRNRSNVKVNGRNRILTKKRNMSKGSKKSQANERKMHKCHLCKYTTSYKSHLTAHIRTHTGEKPFECKICSKTFARKGDLNRHKKTQHSQFEFHCSKCRRGFSNQTDKIKHEESCRVRQFQCYLCMYSTLHLANLKQHMRVHHTGSKPFDCSVCFKSFTTKTNLNSHLRVHKKQLPFDCSKCGQRFMDENGKQKHMNRCKRRQFECYLCSYKCFMKSHLKQHMQLKHTGEKRFKCAICGMKSVHKGQLNKHLATHAKQRTVNCFKYLRRFTNEDDKNAHGKLCRRRYYQCYLCANKYIQIQNLKSHLQKNHINKTAPT